MRKRRSNWLAWGNFAYVYSWTNGMDERTRTTFRRAIDLAEAGRREQPRDPFACSDLALYYAKTGQAELALQRLGTALTLAPDSAEVHVAAAEVYEHLNRRDDAVAFARKSLAAGFSPQRLQRNPELSALLTDPRMQARP